MKQSSKLFKFVGLLLVVGLLFAALPTGQAQAATTVCVNPGGTGYCYSTIQAAVTAATAGDTINVAAGTYKENVVVNKALTLNGAQHGVNAFERTGGESIISVASPADPELNAVHITANGVTLDGFTVTGVVPSDENIAGIRLEGVDGCTLTNNILTGNSWVAINLYGGVGAAYSDSNTVSNNVINGPVAYGIKIKGSDNAISGNHISGADTSILVWSYDATETVSPDANIISGNTIAGGKFGIEIKTGQGNEVTGNIITGTTWAAIHLYTSDRMAGETSFDPRPANNTISNNTITGTGTAVIEVGIFLQEGANTNTISGNTITGTTQAGILGSLSRWPSDWTGLHLAYTVHPDTEYTDYLQIVGNTISSNTITDDGHGIGMEYADNNILTLNTIQGNTSSAAINYHGVAFTPDAAGVYFDTNSTGNVAHLNKITGNTGYDLKSVAALDATSNWWGTAVKATIQSKISGNVDFTPWCGDAACSFFVSTPPVAENKTVTTAEETAVRITLVATDADGDLLTYSVTQPTNGVAVLVGNVVSYTPKSNYFGSDSFTFKANDGTEDSNPATVSITVTAIKDSPAAVEDFYDTNQDTALVVRAADGVMKNDTDVDLNTMTTTLITSVTHGTLTLLGDGSFKYTPAPGFVGTDTFVYQLVTYPSPAPLLTAEWTDEATVTITVTPAPYIYYFPLIVK